MDAIPTIVLSLFVLAATAQEGTYDLEPLADLNTAHSEFSAVDWGGGVVFTSTRGSQGLTACVDDFTGERYADLFVAHETADGYAPAEPLRGSANRRYHDGTAAFAEEGMLMYFARNAGKPNKQNVMTLEILATTIGKNGWTEDYPLSFNLDNYSTCHPTLSRDGKTMIFASNRPGGQGGMDLWASRLTNGEWSEPTNLGPQINTTGNEIFPYLDRDAQLYFSSNGHHRGDDLNVVRAVRTGAAPTDWDRARALPAPINSAADDFAFVRSGDGETGYLSSNRDGGAGGDDIYRWTFTGSTDETPVPLAVIDQETGERLSKTSLTIFPEGTELGNWGPRGRIIESLDGDIYMVRVPKGQQIPDGTVGRVFFTDPNGEIRLPIDPTETYKIIAEREGYAIQEFTFSGSALLDVDDPKQLPMIRQLMQPLAEREPGDAPPPALQPALGPREIPVTLTVFDRDNRSPLGTATVELRNRCTDETTTLRADGAGVIALLADCACTYELISTADNYGTNLLELSPDCDQRSRVALRAPLIALAAKADIEDLAVGERFVLEDVYYDFNKYDIRADAAFDLDEVVRVMKKYPTLEIELSSHTDSRGSDAYNLLLSQNRARAAVAYMVERGVAARRLVARGYGETQLTNECGNGVPCEEEAHQANRRTEIRVTRR